MLCLAPLYNTPAEISIQLLVLLAPVGSGKKEESAVYVSARVCTDDLLCDSECNGLGSEGALPEEWLQDCCKP